MGKGQLWTIIGVALIVAVITSIATVSITGNVINVARGTAGKVYTTAEIDAKLGALKGTCQYVHYKDVSSTGIPFAGMTVMNACQKTFGYLPKIIVETQQRYLHNAMNCSPSYQVFGSTSDVLLSYKTELANVALGQSTSNACDNALFPDGTSNGKFSTQTYRLYSGVLCCKN